MVTRTDPNGRFHKTESNSQNSTVQKRNLQHIHGSSGQRRASAARLALPAGALRLYHRGEREMQVRIDAASPPRRLAASPPAISSWRSSISSWHSARAERHGFEAVQHTARVACKPGVSIIYPCHTRSLPHCSHDLLQFAHKYCSHLRATQLRATQSISSASRCCCCF